MGMKKNKYVISPRTYVSRDTAHAQCKFWQ